MPPVSSEAEGLAESEDVGELPPEPEPPSSEPAVDQPDLFGSAPEEPGVSAAAPPVYPPPGPEPARVEPPLATATPSVPVEKSDGRLSAAATADAVTVLEVRPAAEGGVREAALPGDRSQSPQSPVPARRMGWDHPVSRGVMYLVIVIVLTFVFLLLLINVFRLG